VAVEADQRQALAVEGEAVNLEARLAEAEARVHPVDRAAFVEQRHPQRVERRVVERPQPHVARLQREVVARGEALAWDADWFLDVRERKLVAVEQLAANRQVARRAG